MLYLDGSLRMKRRGYLCQHGTAAVGVTLPKT